MMNQVDRVKLIKQTGYHKLLSQTPEENRTEYSSNPLFTSMFNVKK